MIFMTTGNTFLWFVQFPGKCTEMNFFTKTKGNNLAILSYTELAIKNLVDRGPKYRPLEFRWEGSFASCLRKNSKFSQTAKS